MRRDAPEPISRAELALYAACRVVAVGASKTFFPGRAIGAERLPRKGAYILAPVHRSNLDWLVAARVTRRRLRYLVKDEVWKVRPVGRFIELLGAFPVHRDSADRESLNRALSVLAAGEPLVIFPEGTRREGPGVEELREGTAYLALRAGVPIFPVGLAGTERAMPRGSRLFRPTRVVVVVGEPILPPGAAGATETSGGAADGASRSTRVTRSANRALSEELRMRLEQVLSDALSLERLQRGDRVASTDGHQGFGLSAGVESAARASEEDAGGAPPGSVEAAGPTAPHEK